MRIVWKHLPLVIHKDAPAAHQAAAAAQEQGKFWEFHDKLFADQRNLNATTFRKYARELGLDVNRFEKDSGVLAPSVAQRIEADKSEAASLGVTGTPAFFINGRFLSGAQPFEEFAKLIDAELVRLNLSVPKKTQGN